MKKSRSRIIQLIFFFVMSLFILGFFINMTRIIIPLGLAYVIGLILKLPLHNLMKLGFSRNLSIFIILIGLGFVLVYPMFVIVPTLKEELINLQYYVPKVELFFRNGYNDFLFKIKDSFGLDLGEKFFDDMITFGHVGTKNILLKLPTILASLIEYTFLIPVFIFFILKDSANFKKKILKLVPNPFFERSYYLYHQFNKQLGDYIFAKFVEASIIGLIVVIGLFALKVKFALLLGIFAGVASIIPYVGPVIGAIPGLSICAMEYGLNPIFGLTLILYIVANVIDMVFIFPLLVSKIVNLHPILVIISVILGSQYMGMVGMIISIPVAAVAKLIFIEVYKEIYPVLSRHTE